MRKLLIATHNQGKLKDFNDILQTYNFDIVSLTDLNITQIVEEDGETFADNSLKKAKFFGNLSGLLTLADDGGLEIPILDNKPGVHTRRWESDVPLTDKELINKIIYKLKGKKGDDRRAYLKTIITIYDPVSGNIITSEGCLSGFITDQLEANIIPGYPIRSIFYFPEAKKIYADFSPAEEKKFNHRQIALSLIKSELIRLK